MSFLETLEPDLIFDLGRLAPKSALSSFEVNVFDKVFCPNFLIAILGVMLACLNALRLPSVVAPVSPPRATTGSASVRYYLLVFEFRPFVCGRFTVSKVLVLSFAVLVRFERCMDSALRSMETAWTSFIDFLLTECKLERVSLSAENTPFGVASVLRCASSKSRLTIVSGSPYTLANVLSL